MILAIALAAAIGPQLTRLPNGIPVIVDEASQQDSVSIQVLVRIDDLPPIEMGAAETMAGALFGETENYSLRELRRLAWSIGGAVSAESAGDCLRLEVTTTPDRLRPTAALISDALRRPAFTQASLDYAWEEATQREKWLDRTPPLRDLRTVLAARGIGPMAVTRLTEEQARALHAKVVRPERVAIAVVGKVRADDVATIFGASLGHWQASEAPRIPTLRPDPPSKALGFQTATVTVEGPAPKEKGFTAWAVACMAFGEGKAGQLNRKYRVENALSYVLGSYFTFVADASYCTFYVSWIGERGVKDLPETLASFKPSSDDVDRAKSYLAGRYAVGGPTEVGRLGGFSIGHETDRYRAFWLGWWELKGAGITRDGTFAKSVTEVQPADVARAIEAWLSDGN